MTAPFCNMSSFVDSWAAGHKRDFPVGMILSLEHTLQETDLINTILKTTSNTRWSSVSMVSSAYSAGNFDMVVTDVRRGWLLP